MEWVNITAKSLPEAIDLALDNLGVDEAEAEIVVLEEPSKGLFGRTRGTARVKARVKPRATRPKVDRGKNRRRRGTTTAEGQSSERSSQGRSGRSRNRKRSRGGGGSGGSGSNETVKGNGGNETVGDREQGQASSQASSGRASSGSRNGSGSGGSRSSKKQRRDETPVEEASMEEVGTQVEAFMTGLTEAFGLTGPVSVTTDDEGGVLATVEGQHGLMVGPKGRTLDAIQELARVAAQRTTPSSVRIKIDVGGYRQKRYAALEAFALQAAEAALADGKERSLEAMSSADRKVVHDALSSRDGIETRSAGSEPNRRVVIVPAAPAPADADGAAVEGADATEEASEGTGDVEVTEGAEVVGN